MAIAGTVLTMLVALLHLYFLTLEMFLWDKPYGLRVFGNSLERAQSSRVLAANQGLYNGFLAAGLIWALWQGETGLRDQVFFLCCVVVAGIFGAATVSRKILWLQAFPAALALGCLYFASGS